MQTYEIDKDYVQAKKEVLNDEYLQDRERSTLTLNFDDPKKEF